MRGVLIAILVVIALAVAIHFGGGRFKDVLRGLHGGGAQQLHGDR